MLLSSISFSLIADSFTDRRAVVGLKLFRTLLVADTGYQHHITPDGRLNVSLIYLHDLKTASQLAEQLSSELTQLHDIPVTVFTVTLQDYLNKKSQRSLGIFIADKFDLPRLQQLVKSSVAHKQILFSPYEGDVEKGVLAGLSVESRVRPYLNMQTLKKSQLKIKPFFIKVSKKYAAE
ncbi:MAG: hypothetical protein HRU20_24080 [Pseudomonadales bacterium]|nr:hypothetical protein [Pseudomonadales bacterium]